VIAVLYFAIKCVNRHYFGISVVDYLDGRGLEWKSKHGPETDAGKVSAGVVGHEGHDENDTVGALPSLPSLPPLPVLPSAKGSARNGSGTARGSVVAVDGQAQSLTLTIMQRQLSRTNRQLEEALARIREMEANQVRPSPFTLSDSMTHFRL